MRTEMKTPNPIDVWLGSVAYSKSGSERTEQYYRRSLTEFLNFIGKTAEEIIEEYNDSTDRDFKRKYANYLRSWIGTLTKQGYAHGSVRVYISAVKSFFKHTDLPLGFVPVGRFRVEYHNRDLTKKEIADILSVSRPRDRAFYTVMAQSGLRPYTLCLLRLKNLEPDFSNGTIPCRIDVPSEIAKGRYHDYFTFIGKEAVDYLKDYLKTRPNLTPDSYVFTKHRSENPLFTKSISVIFNQTVRKLRDKGILDFEQKQKGKPAEVRLYNLRKYFRKQSHQVGFEIVKFFMGHTVKSGQDEHYRPKDVEWYRKLYKEKAMPFLRIETATPSETEKQINELRARIKYLERTSVLTIDALGEIMKSKEPDKWRIFDEYLKKLRDSLKSS